MKEMICPEPQISLTTPRGDRKKEKKKGREEKNATRPNCVIRPTSCRTGPEPQSTSCTRQRRTEKKTRRNRTYAGLVTSVHKTILVQMCASVHSRVHALYRDKCPRLEGGGREERKVGNLAHADTFVASSDPVFGGSVFIAWPVLFWVLFSFSFFFLSSPFFSLL